MTKASTARSLIDDLVRATGASDESTAMRMKAREAVARYRATFGEPTMPIDIDALASLLGIHRSAEPPVISDDAELVPTGDGRVTIRVNPDRPETRKRFSIGHEISHTFFPNFQSKSWCRTDGRYRDRTDPDELVEMLCDVGAAELVMPLPWFTKDAAHVSTGTGLLELGKKYGVSLEAMLRRFAETHADEVAAIFLSWKLKPAQAIVADPGQQRLFGGSTADAVRHAGRLRIDYSIASPAFAAAGHYLPSDKSVDRTGPLYRAASTGSPSEGECALSFGALKGQFRVLAVPLSTSKDDLGPRGENGVGAILIPLSTARGGRRPKPANARLF